METACVRVESISRWTNDLACCKKESLIAWYHAVVLSLRLIGLCCAVQRAMVRIVCYRESEKSMFYRW